MKYLMRGKIQKTIAVTMTAFLLLSDTETVTATKTDKNYVEINSEPNFSANKLLSKIKKKSEKKSPVQKQSDKAVIIVEIDGETEDIEGPVDTQDAKSRHSSVFNNINESIANNDELNTEESHVTYLKDYYNIFDGIAVEAYESDVSAIIETEGVKSAYLEKIYSITADEKDDGTEIDDLISLSGIDESDYTGKGQAIAIIDSSLFTGHEVFNTEPEDARYSEDDMEEIRDELGEGCEGSYISAKIPFAYDYADHDNDVNPDNCSSVSARGTHIAGLAVGNADDYRGIAPDAQLIFCKVSPDKKNTVAESDLFSAMDDCLKIGVDEVNLSFSSVTPGFSTTESSALWKDILEKYQEKGIIVNAAAGKNNSDSKENPGSLPDNGNIGRPAAFEKTMAVAGVRLEGMSRSENSFDSAATVGPTPELKLKPDITAPSGIVSASAESSDSYSAMNGIFDETACISGFSALVSEYIDDDKDGYFEGISASEKRSRISQLLMCTAHPQIDTENEIYYSPRIQGAGMADIGAAISTKVYVTVDRAEEPGLVKAELGDNPGKNGKFSFTITLHNMSDSDKSYEPSTSVLSEESDGEYFSGKDYDIEDGGFASVSYGGKAYSDGKISVSANEESSFTVTIKIKKSFNDWIEDYCENGAYIEGFTCLKDDDTDGVNLSVPFLGFYGNWGEINPVFDERSDSEDEPLIMEESYINKNTGYSLGINPLLAVDEDFEPDEYEVDFDKIIVSNSAADCAPSALLPQTSSLRSAAALSYEYRNEDGELVDYYSENYIAKSGYDENGDFSYAEGNMLLQPTFDGCSSDAEEGVYSLKKTLLTAGPSAKKYSEKIDFYYDKSSPGISELKYDGSGRETRVNFTVSDDTAIAGITLGDPDSGEYFYIKLSEEEDEEEKFSINLDEVSEKWAEYNENYDLPYYAVLTAWDYGLNYKSVYLNFAASYQGTNSKYGMTTVEVPGSGGLYVTSYAHVPYFGNSKVINAADLGLTIQYEDISLESSEINLSTEIMPDYDNLTSYLSVFLKGVKPMKSRSSSEKKLIRKVMKKLIADMKDCPIADIELYPRSIYESDKISKLKEAKAEEAVYFIVNKRKEEIKSIKAVMMTHKMGGGTKRTIIKLKEDKDYFCTKSKIYFEGCQVQGTVGF